MHNCTVQFLECEVIDGALLEYFASNFKTLLISQNDHPWFGEPLDLKLHTITDFRVYWSLPIYSFCFVFEPIVTQFTKRFHFE